MLKCLWINNYDVYLTSKLQIDYVLLKQDFNKPLFFFQREKKSMKKRKQMKERDPLLVAHTTGEVEEEASTGASTRVGLEDLLATRMPSWTDQDVSLSSVGHTGGEATEDIMPR